MQCKGGKKEIKKYTGKVKIYRKQNKKLQDMYIVRCEKGENKDYEGGENM